MSLMCPSIVSGRQVVVQDGDHSLDEFDSACLGGRLSCGFVRHRSDDTHQCRVGPIRPQCVEHHVYFAAVFARHHAIVALIPVNDQLPVHTLANEVAIHRDVAARRPDGARERDGNRQRAFGLRLPAGARQAVHGGVHGVPFALALVVPDVQADRQRSSLPERQIQVLVDAQNREDLLIERLGGTALPSSDLIWKRGERLTNRHRFRSRRTRDESDRENERGRQDDEPGNHAPNSWATAGTARALFGVGLVLQVLRRDWDAAMWYFWQAFGLAEALEESGDLYGRSEIHRHVGFYYLVEDVRPREAVRQLRHALALRERLGDPRRIPSALVALGEAELAAGNFPHALDLLRRAVPLAHEAGLLPWRIADAEQNLREAEAAARA